MIGGRAAARALIFTACYSRHCYVHLSFRQDLPAVISGFDAAWAFFGGVFKVVIPDNMAPVVDQVHPTDPRLTGPSPNGPVLQFGLDGEGGLDGERCEGVDEQLPDRLIQSLAGDRSTGLLAVLDAVTLGTSPTGSGVMNSPRRALDSTRRAAGP